MVEKQVLMDYMMKTGRIRLDIPFTAIIEDVVKFKMQEHEKWVSDYELKNPEVYQELKFCVSFFEHFL